MEASAVAGEHGRKDYSRPFALVVRHLPHKLGLLASAARLLKFLAPHSRLRAFLKQRPVSNPGLLKMGRRIMALSRWLRRL